MKRLSSRYLYLFAPAFVMALVITSTILLSRPPTTAFAARCTALCTHGSDITVEGTSCACTDDDKCTWTDKDGKSFVQKCATPVGHEEIVGEESDN